MYDAICEKLHMEMQRMEDKYRNKDAQINSNDLDVIDRISHALKSMATYEAMESAQEGNSQRGSYGGYSYRRGRDSMGRFTSRDVEPGRAGNYYDEPPMEYRRY